jgi:hypothetical protein
MSRILEYILFRTVLVVITLHAIIPHPHSDELTEEKHFEIHKKSNSFIGIIRLAFHESEDENLDNLVFAQYESVKKLDHKYKHPKVSTLNNMQSIIVKRETERIANSSTNNFNGIFFVKLNGLRGPPLSG